MGKGTYGSQVGRPKKKKMGMNPGGMAKKPMNEGMKALKKAAPEVAKRMGFNYGSMVKKKMGMMGGGMSKKMRGEISCKLHQVSRPYDLMEPSYDQISEMINFQGD